MDFNRVGTVKVIKSKNMSRKGKENERENVQFKLGTELLFHTLAYQMIPFYYFLVVSSDKMD